MNFRDEIRSMFLPGGALQKVLPGFEARAPQLQMAECVAESISQRKHALCQAAVGTGKTFGYLLPACRYAVEQNLRVVVSTHTKSLQQKILNEDLPLIQRILAADGHDLTFVAAMGQANYLCLQKLMEQLDLYPEDEMLQQISAYEEENEILGDIGSFPFPIPVDVWERISGCVDCNTDRSSKCYFKNAKSQLRFANVIVSNHSMFLSDLRKRSRGQLGPFPDYDIVIFDEAHRLDEVYAQYWTRIFTLESMEVLLAPIQVKKEEWMKDLFQGWLWTELLERRKVILDRTDSFLKAVQRQLIEMDSVILESPVTGESPVGADLYDLVKFLRKLKYRLEMSKEQEKGVAAFAKRIETFLFELDEILVFHANDPRWANWIERIENDNPSRQIVFKSVPYFPNVALEDLHQNACVIYTSGTIAPDGDFSLTAEQLGLPPGTYNELNVKSPYDYYKDTMIVVPYIEQLTFDASDDQTLYYDKLTAVLMEIFEITQGSTFVLFTSFEAIRQVESRMEGWFQTSGLNLLAHHPRENKEALLQRYMETERGILFGAESFWEGIDVPGDALRCVVIPKLPFPNMQDMLQKSRMLMIEKSGGNGFYKYTLPIMIRKLVQGFGRLKRASTDRGAVILLDNRIHTKAYGDRVLRSLPNSRRSKSIQDIRRFFE